MNSMHLTSWHQPRMIQPARFGSNETEPVKPAETKPPAKPVVPKATSQPGFFQSRWNAATEFVDGLLLRDPQSVMAHYIAQDLQAQISGKQPLTWQVDNYNFNKGKRTAYSFVNPSLAPRLKDSILNKLGVLHKDAEGKPVYSPLGVSLFRSHQGVITMEVNNRLVGIHETGNQMLFGPASNTRWIFRQLQGLDNTGKLEQTTKAKESIASEADRTSYLQARTSLIQLLADKATVEKKEVITGENVRYAGQTRFTLSGVQLPENVAKTLYLPADQPVSLNIIQNGSSWQLQYEDRSLFSPRSSNLDPKWEWWNRNIRGAHEEDIAFSKLAIKLGAYKN